MELTGWLSRGTDPLAELEKLCGHRWESHALFQLAAAAGPLRRADLAAAIRSQCGGRPDDTQLGRTLRRLTAERLVHSTPTADGHRQYTLTAQGRQRVARLEALTRILLRWYEAPEPQDPQS
jgi:DNA-binding PadR family transcriptional regulator